MATSFEIHDARRVPLTAAAVAAPMAQQAMRGPGPHLAVGPGPMLVPSAPPPPVQVVFVGPPVYYAWRPQGEQRAAKAYYGKWSAGTCGCCFDPLYSCLFFLCFPCALVLRVKSIVEKVGSMQLPIIGKIDRSNALIISVLAVLLFWVGGIPSFIFFVLIYKGVQTRFAIPDSDVCIFLKVFFCPCCSIIKLGRHVDGYHNALFTV